MADQYNPFRQILDNFYRELSVKLPPDQLYRFLEFNVIHCQNLMGIGTGSEPDSSGENIVFDLLKKAHPKTRPLCIFDVGSNKGQYLFLIRQNLQDLKYHVHAFEPGYNTFQILQSNLSDAPNISLNNFALGKEEGESLLFYDESGSGLASLYKRRLDHYGIKLNQDETVNITTIDDYCHKNDINEIDLLKMDVEGHELDVLNGGTEMFRNNSIEMVTFEFGGCNIDSRTFLQDFFYFFKDHGMSSLYRITPSGYLMAINHYKETDEQFRTTNYLVLRG